ncbi:hypothetical protein R1flu_013235 [Riccia fluitans]|uniref:DUF4283 domain-containing protein n=1 Tax=Riccia fluitans TaxID=41844 RepID=A0ABD1YCP1_9MARC
MEPSSPLNKSAGCSQDGNQEPEQHQLPKVLYKASLSEVMKGKAPAMENHTNGKSATYASKVAASEHGAARLLESRVRNADAWRAARERRNISLKAASTLEECIRKNRDHFQRVNNGRTEENPYMELGQQVEMTEERREEIRETFQFLRQTHAQTQGKVVRAIINAQQLSNRIQFLKEKTFVLYTVDISPSRDAILEWAEAVLHQEMGIRILRVRVLNKHCYLITVENELDRDCILDAAPLFLGPHMVFALPWDPRFDSAKLDNCKVPVWVELPNIHPCLEAFGTQLLQSIGEQAAQKGDAGENEKAEQQNRDEMQTLGRRISPKLIPTDEGKEVPTKRNTNRYDVLAEEEPRCEEEDEPILLRENEEELAGTCQVQLDDDTETNAEQQSQQVLPLDQNPVRMETTTEKRKRVPLEKENGGGLEMAAPDVAEIPAQFGTPKNLNLGTTQGNSSKKQGAKRTASKTGQLAKQGSFAVDYTEEGKAGAALIFRRNWKILAEGRRGDGTAVWMKARTELGEIGFASVHGPRDRTSRARLWKWLLEICAEGVWILGGDWNSVETWEDSVGESPIQRGTEQRRWNALAAQLDLADGWTEASSHCGPHFTRQPQFGEPFDQARLDRVYFGRSELWAGKHIHIKHDEQIRLSDHHPVFFSIHKARVPGSKRSTDFKTDPRLILKPEVAEAAIMEWSKAGLQVEDVRVQWELKWAATREYLKQKQKEKSTRRQNYRRNWQKCKESYEEISTLVKDDGTRLEEDDSILEGLQQYYQDLYRQYPVSEEDEKLRKRILNLVHRKLSSAHNAYLIEEPKEDEIGKEILHLKRRRG